MQPERELLERERELEALEKAIARGCAGAGSAVLVEGPAGIGKSSLIRAGRERAGAAGMRVLAARGSELERSFAYGVVRQLFERPLLTATETERTALLHGSAGLAAGIFGLDDGGEAPGASEEARLHGLFWLAVNLAEREPLALAVDDLHWCDAGSLRWLGYLLGRLEGLSILVLSAFRPAEPGSDAELLAALAAEPAAAVVRPARLSRSAAATLVRAELSAHADDDFCAACHDETSGNPLLLRELVSALAAEGVDATAGQVHRVRKIGAHGVSRTVALRLASLPDESAAFVRAVAVLGDDVDLAVAAELAGLGRQPASTAAATLTRTGLLRGEPQLTFVHPVVRAAIYEELTPSERERAHARAAAILARREAPPEQVAAHLLLTDPARDAAVVTTLRTAAATALTRGAAESAAAYLRRALAEPPPLEERVDLLLELSGAERLVHGPSAADHLREALQVSSDPRQRAEIALELGRTLYFSRQGSEAIEVLEAGLSELPPGDGRTRRRLEAAFLHAAMEDPEHYPRAARVLDRIRADSQDSSPEARALLAVLAYHDTRAGSSLAECVAHAEQALAGPTPPPEEGVVFAFAGFVLAAADRFDAAASLCDEVIADARARGSVFAYAIACWLRGRVNHLRGALDEAEADLRNSIEAGRSHGLYPVLAFPVAKLADVLIERGDVDGAAEALASLGIGDDVPDTPHLHTFMETRGRLRVLQGRAREGLAELLELGRRFDAIGGRNPAVVAWRSEAALALRALGEGERARALAQEEVELALRWGAPRTLARALRIAGLVDDRERLPRLRDAVDAVAESAGLLERAYVLFEYGAALRRANQRSEARAPLREAIELARLCGAPPLVQRAHDELLATGARPRRTRETGVEALTASERRVAQMAAEGLTNREIAQALFVTPKTIEMHLHGVFQKLNVRSRTQLASALDPATDEARGAHT